MGLLEKITEDLGSFTHLVGVDKVYSPLDTFGISEIKSFLSGSKFYSFSLLSGNYFRLIVIDVDQEWEENKVLLFLNYLFEVYNLKAYAEKSIGGRIHVLIPFNSGIKFDESKIFLKFIESVAIGFWRDSVEVFPNGRSITLIFDEVYGRKGLLFSNSDFKKKLRFFYRFFKKPFSNTKKTFEEILKTHKDFFGLNSYVKEALSSKSEEIDVVSVGEELEDVFREIVQKIAEKDYVRGRRNDLIFELSGFLAFMGKSFEEIKNLLWPLIERDDERDKRIELIIRALARKREGKKLYFKQLLTMFPSLGNFVVRKSIEYAALGDVVMSRISKETNDKRVLKVANFISKLTSKYGSRVVLGYNSLSKNLNMSKRDVSFALKMLSNLGIIRRIAKGRYLNIDGEKISIGSIYEVCILSAASFVYKISKDMKFAFEAIKNKIREVGEFYFSRANFEYLRENKFLLLNLNSV
ncbi:hypothetical protein YS40_028 [Thermus phage phiYS40]|uniref:hypothetical protein n=1 Tax=Thermus phage phiYS40 TaxID=407392 RepID=UPI0000E68992|nr:hypothetical protein YS40_028 [Thermus phage phiYS40]ABJ91422.1 hypothetical protein YS40_028 [Thermus phage phiYS40]BAK53546.1 hypothetical protein YSP_028 [Thermus phage phiYS40]